MLTFKCWKLRPQLRIKFGLKKLSERGIQINNLLLQRDRIVFFIPPPGIEPGDRKIEGILNINTIFDENYGDTYVALGEYLS